VHWHPFLGSADEPREGLSIAAAWNGSERQWRRMVSWFLEPKTIGQFQVVFDLLAPLRLVIIERPSRLVFVLRYNKDDETFSLLAPEVGNQDCLSQVLGLVEFLLFVSVGNWRLEADEISA